VPGRRRRHVQEVALVTGLVLVSAAVRFVAARGLAVPWIAPDEIIYALLGRSLFEDGTLDILGSPTPYYSLLYPAVVGLPLGLDNLSLGISILQAVQALVMSATAAIVYVWARPLAGRLWAFAGAALAVAIPGLAYSGLVMTEAVVYPLVTLALWALARMLAEPTARAQWLFVLLCAAAVLTRLQALVLLPTAVVAILVAAALGRDRRLLRACAPLLAAAGTALAAGLLLVAVGRAPLGGYTDTVEAGYDVGDVARDIARHAGDVVLLVAAVPLVALAALTVEAVRRREPDPRVRAALAVALAYVPLLVTQVGAFASRFVGHLAERDLLTAVPPLLVVFALWLGRGLPRSGFAAGVAALAIAAAAILLPIGDLTQRTAFLDSFTTIPLRLLAERTSEDTMRLVFVVTVASLVALAMLVPRRAAVVLPLAVGATLLVITAVASAEIRSLSRADERWWFATAEPAWVDDAADGPVTYLHADTEFWGGVWKHAFWNHRIAAVARLPNTPLPGPIGATVASARFDGLILDEAGHPLRNRLMVVPRGVHPRGEPLAGFGPSSDQPGLELWRVEPPARIDTWIHGLDPNGDLRRPVTVTIYSCARGRLELTLLGKDGTPVEARVDGGLVRRIEIAPGEVWNGQVPVVPHGGRRLCLVELRSAGLVGSTRIELVRG
jgi:hypothetical protein